MMISGCMTKDGLSKSIAYPCEISGLRVKSNSVLHVQCDNRIHSRFAEVKT